jgi:hypothetical protein
LYHKGHQLPQLHVNLQEWNKITDTAMDLPNTLAKGHAELINMLNDMNRTGTRFADYAAKIKEQSDLQPIDPGQTNTIYVHHYLSYGALLLTLTILAVIACLQCRKQGICHMCCGPPATRTQPESRGRDSLVVNFAPKSERVRFMEPNDTKIVNSGRTKTRRANRPTQTDYEE